MHACRQRAAGQVSCCRTREDEEKEGEGRKGGGRKGRGGNKPALFAAPARAPVCCTSWWLSGVNDTLRRVAVKKTLHWEIVLDV